jgi:hypothetical protein
MGGKRTVQFMKRDITGEVHAQLRKKKGWLGGRKICCRGDDLAGIHRLKKVMGSLK